MRKSSYFRVNEYILAYFLVMNSKRCKGCRDNKKLFFVVKLTSLPSSSFRFSRQESVNRDWNNFGENETAENRTTTFCNCG